MNQFDCPRVERVIEGAGAADRLVGELDERGLGRVFVTTGTSVSRTRGFERLIEQLGARAVGVFAGVRAHNPDGLVEQLIAQARDVEPDVFVGVGGGSPVDAAKFGALGVAEGASTAAEVEDYAVKFEYPDREIVRPLRGRPVPVVAVPTTLSAAEWDGFAGTTDLATGVKHVIRYLELTPRVVVLDPRLAEETPRDLWATTGVRAVDHAVETIYARNAHPLTTALALGALQMLAEHLVASTRDATDHAAALACQRAAWMSIAGVHNVSLGLSHGIGHQLGGMGVPHGVTSCIMLPHVMRFLEPATGHEQARIAEALEPIANGTAGAAARVERLFDELEVPRHIAEFSIPRERLREVARATMGDVVVRESPVEVTEDAVVELLERAW